MRAEVAGPLEALWVSGLSPGCDNSLRAEARIEAEIRAPKEMPTAYLVQVPCEPCSFDLWTSLFQPCKSSLFSSFPISVFH